MNRSLAALVVVSLAAYPLAAHAKPKKEKHKEAATEASSEAASEPPPASAPAAAPAAEPKTAAPSDKPAAVASAAPEQEGRFKIRRGFFAESDVGVFLTFGGKNTNELRTDGTFASKTVSNVEPHLGVNFGYDIASGDSYDFALGVKLGVGFNGGSARVSSSDEQSGGDLGTKSNDYSVYETGLLASLAILMTDRLAITIRADGGMALVSPDPTQISVLPEDACPEGSTPIENGQSCVPTKAGSSTFAPVVGGGIGLEYYTLLNDFSIGLVARFQALMLGGMIPGMTITVPIKYTF